MSDPSFDFAELALAMQENSKPEVLDTAKSKNAQYAFVPKGMELKSLKPLFDELKTAPDRRTGTIIADTVPSFIDVTNRFKADESVVYARAKINANEISASLTTIFDYHPQGADNTAAKFLDHRAEFKFPISKDFRSWLDVNGKPMDQLAFAQFLEDRVVDMVTANDADMKQVSTLNPKFADPATILGLSRDLEIYSTEEFKTKTRLATGEYELKFTANHSDASGQPVSIPDFFVINVPIFEGGQAEHVLVRLRYRKDGPKLVWWFDLYRVDISLEAAFNTACDDVRTLTSLPVYIGAPEGVRQNPVR